MAGITQGFLVLTVQSTEVSVGRIRYVLLQSRRSKWRSNKVPQSVLDAIKLGIWDFEPDECEGDTFNATRAMPGSSEKLAILSARVSQGLPLWHPDDRRSFDDER